VGVVRKQAGGSLWSPSQKTRLRALEVAITDRDAAMLGTAVVIFGVVCAAVAWKVDGPKQASGTSVTVSTIAPPDTPPINPRAKKE
jgi:hypothetical protein